MLIILGNIRSGVLDITRAINMKPKRGRSHHNHRVVGWVRSRFCLVKQSQGSISNNPVRSCLQKRSFISPYSNISAGSVWLGFCSEEELCLHRDQEAAAHRPFCWFLFCFNPSIQALQRNTFSFTSQQGARHKKKKIYQEIHHCRQICFKTGFIGTLTLTFPSNGPNSKDVICTQKNKILSRNISQFLTITRICWYPTFKLSGFLTKYKLNVWTLPHVIFSLTF